MPRCLHPQQTFDLVLESDHELGPNAPFFTFRTLTGREVLRATDIMGQMQTAQEQGDVAGVSRAIAKVYEILRMGLVGWANVVDHRVTPPRVIPYDPAAAEDVLDLQEAIELMQQLLASANLSRDDKKKFESPAASVAENSVSSVDLAIVPTRRPSLSPRR